MSTTVTAEHFLAASINLATANVLDSGGPFGAVVVTADGRAFEGVNRVTATNDPTAHAEVTAIRNACRELGTFDLSGATLYTSCEPCPMCLASALWARIGNVVFAADRHDAASVGFDDAVFYEYFENEDRDALMPVAKLELGDPQAPAILEPFKTWNTLDSRIDY
ncbi:nucleoside deaminase [Pseudarthrobacter raffinosi]|uniref:nucleoside deaminase n=1 Tax=Pseudarthrobacter raffinosi TaxID=2953651 RepID=UPI00208DFA6B|nr:MULTISPECIES: nucleoside deaminase [unclassified Pseudarthrobacter]MCO4251539.1 nucleoside deaminase [Pseudarthrobacter sp. MDT3-9]MCO4264612.1 nucleoside deaminase [Pseudarthrobacter sp. MDT3-26]